VVVCINFLALFSEILGRQVGSHQLLNQLLMRGALQPPYCPIPTSGAHHLPTTTVLVAIITEAVLLLYSLLLLLPPIARWQTIAVPTTGLSAGYCV
jgi:hypothetical protein